MNDTQKKIFYELIGTNIVSHRKNKGLTQEELASKIGLSRTSIVNIEKGKQNPTLHTIWSIAEVLNITVSDLLPMNREFISPSSNNIIIEEVEKRDDIERNDKSRISDFLKKL